MTSSGIPVFTGHDQCLWCNRTPPAGEPKTAVHVGTTVWANACLDCACDRDNLMQPRRTQ